MRVPTLAVLSVANPDCGVVSVNGPPKVVMVRDVGATPERTAIPKDANDPLFSGRMLTWSSDVPGHRTPDMREFSRPEADPS